MPILSIPAPLTRHEALSILAAQTGYSQAELWQMNRHTLYAILCGSQLERTEAAQVLLDALRRAEIDPRQVNPL